MNKVAVGESSVDCSFKGVAKKAVICVSWLHGDTNVDPVCDYLNNKGIEVFSCHYLNNKGIEVFSCYDVSSHTKSAHYTTFRICVAHSHLHRILDSALWPLGVVIRPWAFKPKQEKSPQQQ